jgi:ribosomal-protein-serine acetyltransferase
VSDQTRSIRLAIPEELRAGSLVLRSWRADDVPSFQQAVLENLDHLRPWMPWVATEPVPIEERAALVERWARAADEGTDWMVGIFLDGLVAGSAGLHQRRGPGVLEIGYWVHRSFTGRGIATLTSYLLTEFAFGNEKTDAVEIWHDSANVRSGVVPRRLGYEFVDERPADPGGGSPGDAGTDYRWRATRTTWPERRPTFDSVMLRP